MAGRVLSHSGGLHIPSSHWHTSCSPRGLHSGTVCHQTQLNTDRCTGPLCSAGTIWSLWPVSLSGTVSLLCSPAGGTVVFSTKECRSGGHQWVSPSQDTNWQSSHTWCETAGLYKPWCSGALCPVWWSGAFCPACCSSACYPTWWFGVRCPVWCSSAHWSI